jgi:hypothetical protein|tara:strand:- start:4719 stop:4907 length:189 start_codon:yes stop_codon:yes gene_type:complete
MSFNVDELEDKQQQHAIKIKGGVFTGLFIDMKIISNAQHKEDMLPVSVVVPITGPSPSKSIA